MEQRNSSGVVKKREIFGSGRVGSGRVNQNSLAFSLSRY